MNLRFKCPACPAEIDWSPGAHTGRAALDCPRCNRHIELASAGESGQAQKIDRCPVCGSTELYIRKDFPQGLGVLIVALAAIGSFWLLETHWFAAWGLLLAAVAADVLLYAVVGFITCCYRCKAEIRGVPRNERHDAFDLATAEKYG